MTEELEQALVAKVHGIEKVATSHDIVGAVAYEADVSYGADRAKYTFVGSMFGSPGPVLLLIGNEPINVHQPERFGVRFNDDWVRNFYK
jgi:hypothetical protein